MHDNKLESLLKQIDLSIDTQILLITQQLDELKKQISTMESLIENLKSDN